jgi:hypothetical protein
MMRSCGILEKVLDDLCWKGLKAKVKDRVLFLPVIRRLEDVK